MSADVRYKSDYTGSNTTDVHIRQKLKRKKIFKLIRKKARRAAKRNPKHNAEVRFRGMA